MKFFKRKKLKNNKDQKLMKQEMNSQQRKTTKSEAL